MAAATQGERRTALGLRSATGGLGQWPGWLRGKGTGPAPRVRTLAFLVLASIALIATTEVGPRVTSEARGQLVLSEHQPQRVLSVTILVSAETFSAAPPPGGLIVSLRGRFEQLPPGSSHLPVRTTYPEDFPSAQAFDFNGCVDAAREGCHKLENRRFSLATCRGECRLSLPITVEWVEPPPGGELDLEWHVKAILEYPVDATAPAGAAVLVEGIPQ